MATPEPCSCACHHYALQHAHAEPCCPAMTFVKDIPATRIEVKDE